MIQNRLHKDSLPAGASPVIRALLQGTLSVAELRAMSPLSEDAQKVVDQAVVRVGMERLVVVDDLISEGLTYPLADPLSVMELQWDTINKVGGAQRTMSPAARGENQLLDRVSHRIPIYLTTDDFFMGVRTVAASRRSGNPIDVTMAEEATRRVNEAIEDAAINGAGTVVAGNDTPGILTAPNVNPFTYETNTAWDAAGKDGSEILADVLGMIDLQQAVNKYGPYNLYVNTGYGNKLNEDFKANGDKSILQRLQEIVVGGRNLRVRVADRMPANRTALVQMTSDVIDVITGQAPTLVSWTSNDMFTLYWMVMAIMVPRVRSDYDGQSGIVVGNV